MKKLSEEERLQRKERRKVWFKRVYLQLKALVSAAEELFEDGQGEQRKQWVIEQAVKHIDSPLGDKLEEQIISFLIELILSEQIR